MKRTNEMIKFAREDLHEFPITSNGYIKLQLRCDAHRSVSPFPPHSQRYNMVHLADSTKYCDDAFDTCFFYSIGHSLNSLHLLFAQVLAQLLYTLATKHARKIELNTMNDRPTESYMKIREPTRETDLRQQ